MQILEPTTNLMKIGFFWTVQIQVLIVLIFAQTAVFI